MTNLKDLREILESASLRPVLLTPYLFPTSEGSQTRKAINIDYSGIKAVASSAAIGESAKAGTMKVTSMSVMDDISPAPPAYVPVRLRRSSVAQAEVGGGEKRKKNEHTSG